MNTENNVTQKSEEFYFSHLFFALWKNRILIVTVLVITTILTGAISMLILKPVYDCNLNIVINMPETYTTKYGDYTLPISTNKEYISLITSNNVLTNTIKELGYKKVSVEDLKDSIKIGTISNTIDVEQNSFDIKISANSPKKAHKIALTLYKNYLEFLDISTFQCIDKYYSEQFKSQIEQINYTYNSNIELLKSYEKLLATIPQMINQDEALKDIKGKINGNDILILENVSNPNYIEVEKNYLALKEENEKNSNKLNMYKTYLHSIDKENKEIENYFITGNINKNIINSSVTATSVSLPSSPVIPTRKTGPSNIKNIILGAFLGVILGCFIAIIKEFMPKCIAKIK